MKRRLSLICVMLLAFGVAKAQSTLMDTPSGLTTVDIDLTQATLCWADNENAETWILSYKVFQQSEPTIVAITDTVYYLQDLTSGTRYLWAVRAVDTGGDTTLWSETQTFVTLGFDSDCPVVENLSIGNIDQNGISVQWTAASEAESWDMVVGSVGSNPDREGVSVQTLNYETSVGGLTPLERYQVALRSNCGSAVSNWRYIYAKYLPYNVQDLPIQLDFESEEYNSNIGFINSASNAWEIGEAENASSIGSRAIYISNDNGLTSSCDVSSPSISYAYVDIAIPEEAVGFYIDFKYKTHAPLQGSGLKVFMLSPGSSLNIDQLPYSANQIGAAVYTGGENVWENVHIELPALHSGTTQRILFAWENTSEATSSSAVAIDDLYITARYCATPTNLRAEQAYSTSAFLTWDIRENQASYKMEYKQTESMEWTLLENVMPNSMLEGLESATSYTFRVQANCTDENSFWSDTAVFLTSAMIYPPTGERIVKFDENSALIRWNQDPLAHLWIVETYNPTAEETTQMQVSQPEAQLENLAEDTFYQIRLRAVSENGDTSNYSSTIELQTLCNPIEEFAYFCTDTIKYNSSDGVCMAHECWRVFGDTVCSPMFNLSAASNPVLNFEFRQEQGGNPQILVSRDFPDYEPLAFSVAQGANSILLSDFTDEERLMLAFRFPQSNEGNSRYEILNFTIKDTCLTPDNLTVNHISSTSATLEWNAYDNNTNYTLAVINPASEDTLRHSGIVSPFVLSDLMANTEYILVLGASCGEVSAENISIINFTTAAHENPCATPTNFLCQHYQTKGDETIICTWDNLSESPYIQWEMQYKETLALDWASETVSINPRFTLRNLELGSSWDFRLRAICAGGDLSDWTEIQTVLVGDQAINAAEYSGATFKLYPNPADKVIYVETSEREIKDAQLLDATGRVLKAWDVLPETIDVSSYPQGTYFINVTLNGARVSKKVNIK